MKKLKNKYLIALLMIMILPISLLLVNAEDTKGKIEIAKNATKIYDTVDENNLVYGRNAKVTLNVNANPYSIDSFSTLDIVLIIDESGSMSKCAKYYDNSEECQTTKIEAAKTAANNFINTMIIDNKTNVKIGIVNFSSKTNETLELTYDKNSLTKFINDNLSPKGGTNIDDAIDSANNMIKKSTADKKMVVLLSDGGPTYFTYDNKIFGKGDSDNSVAYTCKNPQNSWNKADQYTYSCKRGTETKPSTEAINAATTLKTNNNLTFYTIGFGIKSDSNEEKVLKKLPTNESNYLQALDADSLYKAFVKITEEAVEKIATNTTVVDTIPASFTLSNSEKDRLEALGVIVTNNTDGTTTLTWTIGDLYASTPETLTYEITAKDDFHGSMYTNESAVITANVSKDNPYYNTTNIKEYFNKPAVDIPAITNNDHYNEYESYISYEGTNVNATDSILKNDINKNILTNNQMVVNDKIVIITNENTIKNTDGTYTIKDKGILTINNDGTFTFIPNNNYSGEVSFEYQILTEIISGNETNYVISDNSTVTMLIKPRATTEINGTKTWNDENNKYNNRPNEITITLIGTANGNEVVNKTIKVSNPWNYNFNNLYKYVIGHENDNNYLINYIIKEQPVTGYNTTYNDNNITNTLITTNINGTKTWIDNNNQDGKRPTEITINLYANGEKVNETTTNANKNWKYEFTNLPVYKNGEKITYTINENKVNDYTTTINEFNITNTHEIEKTSVTVNKQWNDNNNQDGKRYEVIAELYKNGTATGTKVTLNENNNYTATINNLDKYENGNIINYTFIETNVENGYSVSYSNNGLTITNTRTPETTNINGTKTWDDNNNQDGKRPTEITINLYANGVKISETTTNANKNWKYEFTNLPVYKNSKKITYTINENEVNGYTTIINEFNITNKYTPEKTSVTVNKIWNDNDNQDGKRYEVIAELYKNGNATGTKVTLNIDNRYSATIDNLDKYENGNIIKYTFIETNVENGYSVNYSEDGLTIINSKEVEKVNVTVNKQWIDSNNQDGMRYEVIAELYKNGNATGTKVTLNESNNYTATINNLDKYENGNIINYTFIETNVENGYSVSYSEDGLTIINTREVEKIDIPVNKIWEDNDNQDGIRTEKVIINLTGLVGEKEVFSTTLTLSEENNWNSVFEDLNKYYEGKIINYIINEENVTGYSTTIIKDIDGVTITNTHTPEVITISGNKNWDDAGNQDGLRPEFIEITLIGTINDEIVYTESKNITENDNWAWTFTNAPKYSNGTEISYYIKETNVEGYETIYDENNYNVTNSYIPETVSIRINKNWNDYENNDRIRPNNITVKLLADNIIIDEITISEEDNWTYEFTNLPKYKNQGTLINYSIIEDEVIGYETNIGKITEVINDNNYKNTNYLIEITNTHEKEKLNIEGTKTWIDNDNEANMRPKNIIIDLYADNNIIETINVSEEDKWKYLFKNLDKYKDGIEIKYTIKEHSVENYTTKYDGYNVINLFGGTGNIEEPPKTGVEKTNNYNILPILYMLLLLLYKKVIVK